MGDQLRAIEEHLKAVEETGRVSDKTQFLATLTLVELVKELRAIKEVLSSIAKISTLPRT